MKNIVNFDRFVTENKSNREIILYHGTQASFDKFDIGYLNSGWGEQAYGYGFYLTDNYEAAKEYSRGGHIMKVSVPAGKYLSYKSISRADSNAIARKFFKYYTETDEYGKEAYPDAEARRLFWEEECRYIGDCRDGGDIYGTLASLIGSDKDTSEFLRDIGYIGIKFPGDNGMTGEKFTNYVIFDAKDITVLE